MKSAVTIVGTLLFAAMLVPAAHSQEKAAKLACEGQSKGLRLTPQQFEKLLDDARAAGRVPNFCEAVLDGADLNGAELYKVNLSGAKLVKAHLRGAHLSGAILRGANLYGADLTGADLTGADLSNANMITTVLRRAQLGNADMSKADLTYADMKGTFFEPRIPPDAYDMAFAYYLSDLTYELLPIALFTIREAFKRGGLGQQERKVTYAIKRTEVAKSIQGTWSERIETADSIILPEKQKAGFVEYAKYWLNVVLFDLTFQYGMNAGRPLQILTALIFVFLIPYTIALKLMLNQLESKLLDLEERLAETRKP